MGKTIKIIRITNVIDIYGSDMIKGSTADGKN